MIRLPRLCARGPLTDRVLLLAYLLASLLATPDLLDRRTAWASLERIQWTGFGNPISADIQIKY